MKRKTIALMLALMLAGGLSAAYADAPELIAPADAAVSKVAVTRGAIAKITPYGATVVPDVVALTFPYAGTVGEVHVVPGQSVRAGEVLASLDVQDTLEEIDRLQEDMAYEAALFEIDKRIRDIDIQFSEMDLANLTDPAQIALMENDIALARTQADEAQDAFALSQRIREETLRELEEKTRGIDILAPIDGVVTATRSLVPGRSVSEEDKVLWLADDSTLFVQCEFQKQEKMDAAIDVYCLINGMEYACEYVPMDDREYMAQTLNGGTMDSRFALPMANLPETVRAGLSAAVCVITQQKDDVLIVPSNAVFRAGAARFVYVISDDQAMSLRDVTTGIVTDLLTEITSGLEEGELVYVKE